MERTNSIKFVGDISRTGRHQSGQVFARGGVHTNRECNTTQTFDNGGKKMEKTINLVGGIGTTWGHTFHQEGRVYRGGCSPTMTTGTANGLYVKRWKSELNKQQKKDT